MPTVKEIKKELDALGVEYSSKDKKADLEKMLNLFHMATDDAPEAPESVVDEHENRPRNIKGERPEYIAADDDFVDPNADPATQA